MLSAVLREYDRILLPFFFLSWLSLFSHSSVVQYRLSFDILALLFSHCITYFFIAENKIIFAFFLFPLIFVRYLYFKACISTLLLILIHNLLHTFRSLFLLIFYRKRCLSCICRFMNVINTKFLFRINDFFVWFVCIWAAI